VAVRAFVDGGGGMPGRRLAPHLVTQGHHLTAATTTPTTVGSLARMGAGKPDLKHPDRWFAGTDRLRTEDHGSLAHLGDEPAPADEWVPDLAACAGATRPMRLPVRLARRELGRQPRHPSWRRGFKEESA
jgi:nucleoside-diphosphate-sugar epimerase